MKCNLPFWYSVLLKGKSELIHDPFSPLTKLLNKLRRSPDKVCEFYLGLTKFLKNFINSYSL